MKHGPLDQQIAGLLSKDAMKQVIDTTLEDGDQAFLLVWKKDGHMLYAQYGMTILAEMTHCLGTFLHGLFAGFVLSINEDEGRGQ